MSNDVSIRVTNQTSDRDLYICVFQKPQEADPNKIFTSLFPVAWEVLALGPSQTCDPIIYPVQLQASVIESQEARMAVNRTTFQNVDYGQVWDFTRTGDFSQVLLDDGSKGKEGVVVLRNKAKERVDVGMAKNGSLLVVQKDLAYDEQADFQLTPSLFFMAASHLQKGDLIRSYQVTQNYHEVSLTNLASIDVTVYTKDPTTGELGWRDSNAISAS